LYGIGKGIDDLQNIIRHGMLSWLRRDYLCEADRYPEVMDARKIHGLCDRPGSATVITKLLYSLDDRFVQ
jgi:hypothetical protein